MLRLSPLYGKKSAGTATGDSVCAEPLALPCTGFAARVFGAFLGRQSVNFAHTGAKKCGVNAFPYRGYTHSAFLLLWSKNSAPLAQGSREAHPAFRCSLPAFAADTKTRPALFAQGVFYSQNIYQPLFSISFTVTVKVLSLFFVAE